MWLIRIMWRKNEWMMIMKRVYTVFGAISRMLTGIGRRLYCFTVISWRLVLVLMEGLATGKPIITTDIPGCRETVIMGKTVILYGPGYWIVNWGSEEISELSDTAWDAMGKFSHKLAEEILISEVIKVYKRSPEVVFKWNGDGIYCSVGIRWLGSCWICGCLCLRIMRPADEYNRSFVFRKPVVASNVEAEPLVSTN